MSNSFRTATGRCIVDGDSLRIERGRSWLANPTDALTSEEIPPWRKAAVVGVFVSLLTALVLLVRLAPAWLSGAVVGLLLAAVAWSAYARRKQPAGSVTLPRSTVVGVDAHDGIPLVTRPRFVVRYRSEGGVKHRYLLCPSRVYGFGAYEDGKALFERHGLLADDDGEETDESPGGMDTEE